MKFSIILLFLFSFNTSANSPFSETTISGIIVHDWGTDILINLSDTVSNSEGCDYNQSLALSKNHPSFDEMYSALLAAFHAGTTIHGWVNQCHSRFKRPYLTRLDLKKN